MHTAKSNFIYSSKNYVLNLTHEKKIYYTLRIAIAMCFIGHGSFGIITKQIWCNYFAVFGIGQELAYRLMPVVGTFDIVFGILMLVYPVRVIPGWLVLWGIITALLRPLSGEPFAEFIERAGNFGPAFALLLLCGGGKNIRGWFMKIKPDIHASSETLTRVAFCLRITVFLLLLGHGWLNMIQKESLLRQYSSLGFTNAVNTAQVIGIFEIIAAFAVLIRPIRQMLLALLIWKAMSELFYPNYGFFEWVERGGSFGSILALWLVAYKSPSSNLIRQPSIIQRYRGQNPKC